MPWSNDHCDNKPFEYSKTFSKFVKRDCNCEAISSMEALRLEGNEDVDVESISMWKREATSSVRPTRFIWDREI